MSWLRASFSCSCAGAEGLLGLRQARAFSASSLCLVSCDALLGAARARGPHVQRLGELRALLAPRRELGAALGVLAFEPLARLLGVAQLRLVPRHLGVRRVQRAPARVFSASPAA